MSRIRKILVLVLIGLPIGAGLGVGFSFWRKANFPVPWYGTLKPVLVAGLNARCSGGATPRILVTWSAQLGQESSALQRSVDGGSWQAVSAPTTSSGQPHAVDTDVQIGKTYRYRLVSDRTPVSMTDDVLADAQLCTTQ